MKANKNTKYHTYATTHRVSVDLTLSENPLGFSAAVAHAIKNSVEKACLYPHNENALITAIAKYHNISSDTILLGAGANELLEDYLKVFALQKSIIVPTATFPESVACMSTLQGTVVSVPLKNDMSLDISGLLKAVRSDTGLIHLCNPNNPTGIWTDPNQLLDLADQSPVPILISEAGADFVGQSMVEPALHPKIIIVRSFSKAYGLAGLRIGYSVAAPEIIQKMKRNLRSYRVDSIAITAAIAALGDQDHLQASIAYILREKKWLMQEMSALGFEVVPSQGQTFIAKIPAVYGTADNFCKIIKKHGAAVVNCSLYEGFAEYIRVSPQKSEINKKFIEILKNIKEKKQCKQSIH